MGTKKEFLKQLEEIQQPEGFKVKTHHKKSPRMVWKDSTITVVPGLAPTINALLAKANAGLPSNISTRVLESHFRNLDLEDIHQMSHAYTTLRDRIAEKNKSIQDAKDKDKQEQHEKHMKILAYIEEQEKIKQNTPNTP
jgi:hypothetical protein